MIGRGAGFITLNNFVSRAGVFILLLGGALGTVAPVSSATAADSCGTPVDFRATGPVRDLPSGDQGDSYTCGFFTAATFLDAFQIREDGGLLPERLPIDPIALAIDLAIESDRPDWLPIQLSTDPLSEVAGRRGSYLCDIVQHVRESGVCDHGDPRVLDREWTRQRTNQAVKLYSTLSKFTQRQSRSQRRTLAATVRKAESILGKDRAPAVTKEELSQVIWKYRDDPYLAVRKLLYPQCEKRRYRGPFRKLPKCLIDFRLGDAGPRSKDFQRSIHQQLSSPDPMPVPVFHCFQVLREGRSYDRSTFLSSSCILHYVNVIGRRKSGGVCQYLIRNSYDPQDRYAISKDWERDGDDFWVDAETFARSAYGIHGLKD